MSATERLSIVIPALDEAPRIGSAVAAARAMAGEVIVVDGGSGDATADVAAQAGARVVQAPRGRGAQMNAGAAEASRPVILFLHADTRLPAGAAEAIAQALDRPGVAAGCFRLTFDAEHPLLRLFSWFSRFETPFTTFGDQAFFMTRSAFDACGGYPDWPLLEDVELRRRIRRRGRFVKLRPHVVTSARRFAADGVLRRQAANAALLLLHFLGVPAARLAGWCR